MTNNTYFSGPIATDLTTLLQHGYTTSWFQDSNGTHAKLIKDGSEWLGDGETLLEAINEAYSHIQPVNTVPVLTEPEQQKAVE